PLHRLYSEASVGKAHKKEMELRPWSGSDFPDWLLAALLESYYGGRAECAVRRTAVPGLVLDFLAQYPTVFVLQGLWSFEIANRIEWREEDPARIQALLTEVRVNDVLRPALWRDLHVLVQI